MFSNLSNWWLLRCPRGAHEVPKRLRDYTLHICFVSVVCSLNLRFYVEVK